MMSQIPEPNPENYWCFTEGEVKVLGAAPWLTFMVTKVYEEHVEGVQTMGTGKDSKVVTGKLRMDETVCISRHRYTREPMVTMTLRRVEMQGAVRMAYIQITAHRKIMLMRRQ